ncbi:hypothetical protein L1987_46052 [Smallanthus sonchifolius]|uniref:Uncharacterized protein n=1 Tax=Smallanthus sonchifolius TaxID=185202 RepID=A0ACB9G0E3_9ASTR|nr:hypothetical protein L1987_46052 [Smallanthus sonchifolius]
MDPLTRRRDSGYCKLGLQRSILSGYGEDETSPGSARVSGCSRRSRVMVNKSQPGQSRSTAKTMSGFAYERIVLTCIVELKYRMTLARLE